ncbi:hypothetical protein PK98_15655 [Croceibacterium mercuriale]|uniref:Uncharacterized protein n=1 Tax=Croceibacterium mercuriale TaxID=1572751 RepID=A0A0B2BWB6_9SPHN|nr:hypothetical protein [Croceibacterium mercuriale]KHL24117.1 hypothetical protein PK98_15655 [Croceibacterium mercuriale]
MSRYYGYDGAQVLPEDLIRLAWSEPMRDLALKVGMSDVGLRKLFVSLGIITPPQGYWNKVRAGKGVPPIPSPPSRRVGEIGRCRVDNRLARLVPEAPPLPSSGPFASSLVPEDLEELRACELKALSKVRVPKTLERAHPALQHILAKEASRQVKAQESQWHWDAAKFGNAVDQRRLRILNMIFFAISQRGHDGILYEDREDLYAGALIGDTRLGLTLSIAGKYRTIAHRGYQRPDPMLPAATPLILQTKDQDGPSLSWQDDATGKLETRIAQIAADLIVAGEQAFRIGLRKAEEWADERRLQREKERLAWVEKRNQQRLTDLRQSGELLRQAEAIRALVATVEQHLSGTATVNGVTLSQWRQWALGEADRVDPVLSGQVFDHLTPPAQED